MSSFPAEARVPMTLLTGPLGSGKTTLVRHVLQTVQRRMAVLVNEFGELAIDSRIIEGRNIRIAELAGGCVCCSLLGEFQAAVEEILQTVQPEWFLVETTGLAEPDALVVNIQEGLPQVRLDGVVTIADADVFVRFPHLGHTTRMQIEAADLILLNKSDLVTPEHAEQVRSKLSAINFAAPIIATQHCQADPDLLFGIGRQRAIPPPAHVHQPEFQSISYQSDRPLQRPLFKQLADSLAPLVYRAKGFVRFTDGDQLFNFVAGRWELEPFTAEKTELIFIGKDLVQRREPLLAALENCK
jgi:G3E family GTPase